MTKAPTLPCLPALSAGEAAQHTPTTQRRAFGSRKWRKHAKITKTFRAFRAFRDPRPHAQPAGPYTGPDAKQVHSEIKLLNLTGDRLAHRDSAPASPSLRTKNANGPSNGISTMRMAHKPPRPRPIGDRAGESGPQRCLRTTPAEVSHQLFLLAIRALNHVKRAAISMAPTILHHLQDASGLIST